MQELQSRNERMFLLTFLVVNVADNRQRLGNNVFQAGSIAQKYNCQLTRLDFQQEEGFMSALPLGYNQIEIQRGLTTSSVAIFVPFTTQELFQDGKEALYCGLNALSNNLIMVDRKLLKNPNGLILGTPGSGKSFSAKREIANVFLVTNDDIIICDPEAEWASLEGGRFLSASSKKRRVVTLPLLASTTRFLTLTVFLGIFASAFSSLTAALSALRTARSSSGRARSSSVKISLGERFAIFITS